MNKLQRRRSSFKENKFFRAVFVRNLITWLGLLLIVLISIIFFIIHISREDEEEKAELVCPVSRQEAVWLLSWDNSRITYYKGGNQYTEETDIFNAGENDINTFAVLSYEDNHLSGIRPVKDVRDGRVLSYSENRIKIWEKNKEEEHAYGENLYVLEGEENNSVKDSDIGQIGSREVSFYMDDGRVIGILIPKQKENMIRVILQAGSYDGLYHQEVTISCDASFTMSCGKRKKKYAKDREVSILSQNSLFQQDSLVFSAQKGAGFTINGIKRGEELAYPGKIELVKREEGILVINELPLEEYLCRVVNSEMPESFGLEAMKAQAVCARSYAAKKLLESEFHCYGADVDDSTSCQVYNNQAMNQTATEAVRATKGQVLWKDGQIETAYYFSTSCGHTSSAGQVWGQEENPENGVWQTAVSSGTGDKAGKEDSSETGDKPVEKGSSGAGDKPGEEDSPGPFSEQEETEEAVSIILERSLSKEEDMRAFLLGAAPFSHDLMLEKEEPWYRWTIKMDKKQWGQSIENRLSNETIEPNAGIFRKNPEGGWENTQITQFGQLEGVKVLKREKSGLVTTIELEGTKETVKVRGEYYIRKILAPADGIVVRQDGVKIENLLLLPSAYFSFEAKGKNWICLGGGYGHGVGMSQYGAKDLAGIGCTYLQILGYYYPDCQLMETGR